MSVSAPGVTVPDTPAWKAVAANRELAAPTQLSELVVHPDGGVYVCEPGVVSEAALAHVRINDASLLPAAVAGFGVTEVEEVAVSSSVAHVSIDSVALIVEKNPPFAQIDVVLLVHEKTGEVSPAAMTRHHTEYE